MEVTAFKRTVIILGLSLFFGMIGGGVVIWALLVKNLFGFAYGYPLLSPDIEDRPITIVQPREVTLEFDIAVENILSDVSKSSALIFTKKAPAATVLDGAYLASEAEGLAAAITGDGWFMTAYPVEPEETVVYIPSFNGGTAHPVETVVRDPHSETSFFKISIETEMRIAPFAAIEGLQRGETVIIVDANGNASLGSLLSPETQRGRNDLIRSSEEPVRRPQFAVPDGVSIENTHIYDTSGALVAIADSNGIFFYTNWEEVLPSVLRGESLKRVYFGVHYVLLSDLISAAKTGLPELHEGAWILGTAEKPPVVRSGPARAAGFQEGEIIIAVERESVTKANDLAALLSQYVIDQEITIRVLTQSGEEEERSVTLGSF